MVKIVQTVMHVPGICCGAQRQSTDQVSGTLLKTPRLRCENEDDVMLETMQSLTLLTIGIIVGPILLGVGLIYGIYHSRRSRQTQPKSTKGTTYAQDQ
jgi:hypothetical protein